MDEAKRNDEVPRGTSDLDRATQRIMAQFATRVCGQCRQPYVTRHEDGDDTCQRCRETTATAERLTAEARDIVDNARLMNRWLQRCGMSPREASAEPAKIAPAVARFLTPFAGMGDLLRGKVPEAGFGFSGPAGCGKTFAIASVMRCCAMSRWKAWAPLEGRGALRRWLGWARWPELVQEFRITSLEDGGLARVEQALRTMAAIEVLVLDDLGAERSKGEDDWATSQLDLLVDRRFNEMRPTWYTTNLTPERFGARYGQRMVSRLCGTNPMFAVPAGSPDLRTRATGGNTN